MGENNKCVVCEMNAKNIVLAIVLALCVPLAAQAQTIENSQEYKVSCSSGAECDEFDVNYESESDNISFGCRIWR